MNPFCVSGEIPEEYFCDRAEETSRLVNGLLCGVNFCVMSPRRMGKSKLIHHCFKQKELADCLTFHVDIYHTTSLREMVYALGREIFKRLTNTRQTTLTSFAQHLKSLSGSIGFDPQTGLPTFAVQLGEIANPSFTLTEIFEALESANRRCIVCIDEFQQISEYPESGVEALLRSHIQNASNCTFVFSGSERHILDEMFCSKARPFFNSVDMMDLEPIPQVKYYEFAHRLFAMKKIKLPKERVSEAYAMMRSNTYYLPKVFHSLYEARRLTQRCNLPT